MASDGLSVPESAALDRMRVAAQDGFGPLFELAPAPNQPVGSSFLILGSDLGASIVLDQGDRSIRALEPDADEPRFVNTSLPAFAAALIEAQAFWAVHRDDPDESYSDAAAGLRSRLASLDPPALESPESWWSRVVEQLEDGLL